VFPRLVTNFGGWAVGGARSASFKARTDKQESTQNNLRMSNFRNRNGAKDSLPHDERSHIFAVQTVISSHVSVPNSTKNVISNGDAEGEGFFKEPQRKTSSIDTASTNEHYLDLRELPPGTITHEPWIGKDWNNQNKLLRYKDLPSWQRDNNFIRTGYRPATASYWKAFQSFGYVHNETGNMWTHAIGAFVMLIITLWTYLYAFPNSRIQWSTVTLNEAFVIGCFFAGAITCLTMSTLFHCFCCHSLHVSIKWNKMDYVGIVALITGSFVPAFYYAFYCDPRLQVGYIVTLGSLGGVCIFIALADRFATPAFRWFRTLVFTILGGSAVIPVIHAFFRYGFIYCVTTLHFGIVIVEGGLYILGALLYGFRWPESKWPGRFDFFGTSHQIFHVLVVAGCCLHYLAMVLTFAEIHGEKNAICPLAQALRV
jgi:adiponectin receptor